VLNVAVPFDVTPLNDNGVTVKTSPVIEKLVVDVKLAAEPEMLPVTLPTNVPPNDPTKLFA
jgi:hypothetical protein